MRRTVAVVAVAATGLSAAAAEAAVDKGIFRGSSAQGDPMGLKVTSTGQVKSFFFKGVHLKCTDGDSLDTPTGRSRIQTPPDVTFNVSSSNTWKIRANDSQHGVHWKALGKFNAAGSKVTGTLTFIARFNKHNQQDPHGKIRCRNKGLKFTLNRR